jgi:hypothetical protein
MAILQLARACRVLVLGTLVAAFGCSGVLGIEDAKCDPTQPGCPQTQEAQVTSALCKQYCDTVMSACTGLNEAYVSMDACEGFCRFLPEGSPGVIGNSVHCRLEVAELAAVNPEKGSYCPAAGPSGDGPGDESDCTGGSGEVNEPCVSLCQVLMPACAKFPQYTSQDDCVASCKEDTQKSPSDEHYTSSSSADPQPDVGNTVGCRLWHVSVAATGPSQTRVAGVHCPHAAGGAPCVTQQP